MQTNLKPIIVFPFHDPDGAYFAHLQTILPLLKQSFAAALLSIPPSTAAYMPANVRWLQADAFFRLHFLPEEMPVGKHFYSLFAFAAAACSPGQVLHLCFIDRLAFALQSRHREQFLHDVAAVTAAHTPLLFQRSQQAWNTHPRNYAEVEHFATTVGELVLGKSLDFAWCHLAVQAAWLQTLLQRLPLDEIDDMSMMAALILLDQERIQTCDVDWLEWEDPYILKQESAALKQAREADLAETEKRLAYVLPMIRKIMAYARYETKGKQ